MPKFPVWVVRRYRSLRFWKKPRKRKSQFTSLKAETDGNALFFLAAGLLSFGKIDVAGDLIDYLPPGRAGIRQLALALVALFPVPEHFDPLQDPEPIKKWLRQNRDQLDWNPNEGQFVWRDKPSSSG